MTESIVRPLVFVGLGNPGKRYELTRHNMGYIVVQAFCKIHDIPMKEEKRLSCFAGKEGRAHLMMPTTYMNESGQAVRKYLDYYKLTPEDVVVITDDVAIPFGELRLRTGGTSGGHNGLKSIQQHLATTEYTRLRVGVGRGVQPEQELSDYVLGNFSKLEQESLPSIIGKAVSALEMLLRENVSNVMNKVNQ